MKKPYSLETMQTAHQFSDTKNSMQEKLKDFFGKLPSNELPVSTISLVDDKYSDKKLGIKFLEEDPGYHEFVQRINDEKDLYRRVRDEKAMEAMDEDELRDTLKEYFKLFVKGNSRGFSELGNKRLDILEKETSREDFVQKEFDYVQGRLVELLRIFQSLESRSRKDGGENMERYSKLRDAVGIIMNNWDEVRGRVKEQLTSIDSDTDIINASRKIFYDEFKELGVEEETLSDLYALYPDKFGDYVFLMPVNEKELLYYTDEEIQKTREKVQKDIAIFDKYLQMYLAKMGVNSEIRSFGFIFAQDWGSKDYSIHKNGGVGRLIDMGNGERKAKFHLEGLERDGYRTDYPFENSDEYAAMDEIRRIWPEDKSIFDLSKEDLQNLLNEYKPIPTKT